MNSKRKLLPSLLQSRNQMKTGNIKTWKRNSELVIMRNSYNSTVRYMVPKQCQYDCRKHVSTMQCRWSAVPLTSCIKYKRYVDAPKNDTIIQKPGSEHLEIQLLGSSTRGYAITHYKLTESDNARREDILTETEYVNDSFLISGGEKYGSHNVPN